MIVSFFSELELLADCIIAEIKTATAGVQCTDDDKCQAVTLHKSTLNTLFVSFNLAYTVDPCLQAVCKYSLIFTLKYVRNYCCKIQLNCLYIVIDSIGTIF